MPQHVAVETAGKAAVRHNHDEQHVLHFVVLAQQRVIGATYTLGNVGQHFDHGFGVRRRSRHALSSATDLRSRHHLHGARDLLRRRDGADTPFYVVKVGHSLPALESRGRELQLESFNSGVQVGFDFIGKLLRLLEGLDDLRLGSVDEVEELAAEADDVGHRDVVEVAMSTCVDGHSLIHDGHRHVTTLLQQLGHVGAAVQLILGRLVQVAAELRERLQLAIGREIEAQRAGNLLHGLDLRGAADARHRDADVDRRALALEEQVGGQEDLAVRDGDDVGRDVADTSPACVSIMAAP